MDLEAAAWSSILEHYQDPDSKPVLALEREQEQEAEAGLESESAAEQEPQEAPEKVPERELKRQAPSSVSA
jgi:hypothetical protein